MIKAIIEKKNDCRFVAEFPCNLVELFHGLNSIGIIIPPDKIKLTDDEDNSISVKLYSDSDIGNHLICLFSESNTLADVYTTCLVTEKADASIKEELEQNLLNDQYGNNFELIRDIKNMTERLGQVEISFFCPLVGNIEDSKYGSTTPVDNLFLKCHEWNIRELLEYDQLDEMAQYFNDDENIKAKLVSAEWTVSEYKDKLYGRIDCRFKDELTEEETEIFKEWIVGQSADGLGEHIERQPIHTEDGDLFVSFWHPGDSYFLCTEDELDDCIEKSNGTRSKEMRNMNVEEKYPVLIGYSLAGRTRLHSIQDVADFIYVHGQYGDLTITQKDGTPFLDTFGIYINKIVDMEYREELLKILIPQQHEVEMECSGHSESGTDEENIDNRMEM